MIDSLLDYPCVTAQLRASLMREASLTPPVTPFQITDDKPSIYKRMCYCHYRSCVIGSVSQKPVYQSSCLSSVFCFFPELKAMQNWFCAECLNNENTPYRQKKIEENIFYLVTNEKTGQFFPGVKKNTQTNECNNCCFEITCLYPKRAVCASNKCIHLVLLELPAILYEMT